MHLLEDTRFSATVREGFAAIDRGEYIDEEKMPAFRECSKVEEAVRIRKN